MSRFLRSLSHALKGFRWVLSERHFRFHLLATVVVVLSAALLPLNSYDWLWLVLAIALVLIAELINTAIEKLLDRIHPEQHREIGRVKDMSASAVLLAALFSLLVAGLILIPKIFQTISEAWL